MMMIAIMHRHDFAVFSVPNFFIVPSLTFLDTFTLATLLLLFVIVMILDPFLPTCHTEYMCDARCDHCQS